MPDLRDLRSAERLLLLDRSSSAIVAGLETLESPGALGEIVQALGSARTIFSLDLDEGRPRKPAQSAWKSDDSFELASEAIECGAAPCSPARPRAGRNGPRIGDQGLDRADPGQASRSPRQCRRGNLRHCRGSRSQERRCLCRAGRFGASRWSNRAAGAAQRAGLRVRQLNADKASSSRRHSIVADWPKLSSTSTRRIRGSSKPRAVIAWRRRPAM